MPFQQSRSAPEGNENRLAIASLSRAPDGTILEPFDGGIGPFMVNARGKDFRFLKFSKQRKDTLPGEYGVVLMKKPRGRKPKQKPEPTPDEQ